MLDEFPDDVGVLGLGAHAPAGGAAAGPREPWVPSGRVCTSHSNSAARRAGTDHTAPLTMANRPPIEAVVRAAGRGDLFGSGEDPFDDRIPKGSQPGLEVVVDQHDLGLFVEGKSPPKAPMGPWALSGLSGAGA